MEKQEKAGKERKKATEEKREQIIQWLSEMMRVMPFETEFKVKKKPAGIKVIIEVTQEEMGGMTKEH